ncbi:MAG: hypothetical protein R6V85_06965 [Polyangia bacterium]
MRILPFAIAPLAALAACGGEELDPEVERLGRASGAVNAGRAAASPAAGRASQSSSGRVHRGKVVETTDVSRYSYVLLATEKGEELWAAVPQSEIDEGQSVEVIESVVMHDFESPSLDRTFEKIVFGTLAGGGKAAPEPRGAKRDLPPGHPPVEEGGAAEEHAGAELPPGHPPIDAGAEP